MHNTNFDMTIFDDNFEVFKVQAPILEVDRRRSFETNFWKQFFLHQGNELTKTIWEVGCHYG